MIKLELISPGDERPRACVHGVRGRSWLEVLFSQEHAFVRHCINSRRESKIQSSKPYYLKFESYILGSSTAPFAPRSLFFPRNRYELSLTRGVYLRVPSLFIFWKKKRNGCFAGCPFGVKLKPGVYHHFLSSSRSLFLLWLVLDGFRVIVSLSKCCCCLRE